MSDRELGIGKLAKLTGSTVQTIRHYEKIGLLREVVRTEGNQRVYREGDIDRVRFILHARSLGFNLDSIRELLSLADEPSTPCDIANQIAQKHLETVKLRLTKLKSLKTELERIANSCDGTTSAECLVLKSLADHGTCQVNEHGQAETFA